MGDEERFARVLVVEDDTHIASALISVLQSDGLAVVGVAEDARAVVALVQELRPDVVLMDVQLGGSLDGISLAEEILVCEDTPVVLLSGGDNRDDARRAARSGAYAFLGKPASGASVVATLRMAIARHEALRDGRDHARVFSHALEVVDACVVVLQREGEIEFMNRAATALTGWTLTEAKVRRPPWVDQLRPLPEEAEPPSSITVQRRTGEPMMCTVKRFPDANGGTICLVRPFVGDPSA